MHAGEGREFRAVAGGWRPRGEGVVDASARSALTCIAADAEGDASSDDSGERLLIRLSVAGFNAFVGLFGKRGSFITQECFALYCRVCWVFSVSGASMRMVRREGWICLFSLVDCSRV